MCMCDLRARSGSSCGGVRRGISMLFVRSGQSGLQVTQRLDKVHNSEEESEGRLVQGRGVYCACSYPLYKYDTVHHM